MGREGDNRELNDLVYLRALNDRHVSEAADVIELLQRELKCSKEMWEQQQELALEYLADIEKANERIAELETALIGCIRMIDCLTAIEGWNIDGPALRKARKVLGEKQ
jgi:hypothetical protein